MSVTEKVKQTLAAHQPDITKQDEFVKLRDFYTEMLEAGVAQKQSYTLPPLDTAGRRLRSMGANQSKK
jgi:hypothetical protein